MQSAPTTAGVAFQAVETGINTHTRYPHLGKITPITTRPLWNWLCNTHTQGGWQLRRFTWTQILTNVQRAEDAVGDVEVREHLQLDDLVGQVEEGLGIHGDSALLEHDVTHVPVRRTLGRDPAVSPPGRSTGRKQTQSADGDRHFLPPRSIPPHLTHTHTRSLSAETRTYRRRRIDCNRNDDAALKRGRNRRRAVRLCSTTDSIHDVTLSIDSLDIPSS